MLNSLRAAVVAAVIMLPVSAFAQVVAVPEQGNADAGVASRPIANVAANDTINGSPASLGTSGNATVAQSGTWPAGIALTPSTGAVSTKTSVAVGSYPVDYKLCDKSAPPVCTTTTDTVNVNAFSIVAADDTGTADAGTGSKPIANVVTNDSISGVPAVLGASGNATISLSGTWPPGIVLNTTAGSVSTNSSLGIGTYSAAYNLCDLNTPHQCATGNVTVNVINGMTIATPESGTARLGVASTAIPNVTTNDSVHGVAVVLGSTGNATVQRSGTWQTGIALNTATGAITVGASVPAGVYNVTYMLCDTNAPNVCASATDTVTVSASIVVLPVAGSSFLGQTGIAIGNVAIKGKIGSAAATLGSSGNATVAQQGTWQTGITLNTTTGAITVASTVPAGSYALGIQLCDRSTVPNCASTSDNVSVIPAVTENLASANVIGDIEFDWGRDGINCPTCNGGLGNMRFNWTDRNESLWVSGIDPNTGQFVPVSGRQTLVDNTAAFWQDTGNGPEWTFSTPSGSTTPVSQLVYTRYAPGKPATYANAGIGVASSVNGTWNVAFLPGAAPPANNSVLPIGTMCNTDPVAYVLYAGITKPAQQYTEPVDLGPNTVPTLTSFGTYSNEIGERWVACKHWLTFQGDTTVGSNTIQQVFWYDADSQTVQQLTTDPTIKSRALMFKAPELLGLPYQYMLVVVASSTQLQVYQQTGVSPNGAPSFTLYNTIYSPDPTEPYIFQPKVFVHCTPTCHTYVIVGLSHTNNSQFTQTEPNGLAVTNVDPVNPMFKVLVPYSSAPLSQREDPEYFITPNGVAVYYAHLSVHTRTQPYAEQGFFYIDMQLGPPSGPCVGSSAEAGLAGPVGTCQ